MATREAERPDNDGMAATAHAASGGGDKVRPGVLLRIINGDASPKTLTITTPGTAFGQAIDDPTVVVPATSARYWRVPEQGFKGSDGLVALTWSATTSVTFEVIDV